MSARDDCRPLNRPALMIARAVRPIPFSTVGQQNIGGRSTAEADLHPLHSRRPPTPPRGRRCFVGKHRTKERGGPMAKLSLTRRSFLKAAAVTGAASTLSFAVAPSAALAEGVDESAGEVKRIRSCCRACGKCECGVWVTVQDNKVIKVEGDESNAHSRGHCCAKSQASMLALYHPDRLRYTMKRTNPRARTIPAGCASTLPRPWTRSAPSTTSSSTSTAESRSSPWEVPRACGLSRPTAP